MVHHADFRDFLDQADLTLPLLILGSELVTQTVDILKIMPNNPILFEQSPIKADEFDLYRGLAEELRKGKKIYNFTDLKKKQLLNLALRFTPGLHKMGALTSSMEKLILIGRTMFRDKMSNGNLEVIQFFQKEDYIYSETILKNILFGTMKTERADIQEKIDQSIITLLIEEDLLEAIVEIGMQFDVGSKGDRLSGGQRQKLAIARVLLKKPRILILDEATSALDNKSQARIQKILEFNYRGKKTVIAVVHRLDIVKTYDQVAVMKAGKIVEMGTYSELIAKRGALYELEFGSK
jgi:ABC-type multidrug transport system fused ATPase/permease subunit